MTASKPDALIIIFIFERWVAGVAFYEVLHAMYNVVLGGGKWCYFNVKMVFLFNKTNCLQYHTTK